MYDAWFWSRVLVGDECWLWTGPPTPKGYGKYRWEGDQQAHRVAYRMLVGPIPEGLTLDHTCRNRLCVRPAHLDPVTAVVNTQRGIPFRLSLTVCPEGHPYDEANTYRRPDGRGRMCRTCARARSAAFAARKVG